MSRGALAGAVAVVLAGEMTVERAARVHGCDPGLLEARAWADARAAALERDEWSCRGCGNAACDVLRRVLCGPAGTADPVTSFGLQSLVSLCQSCYDRAQARDFGMRERRFWLRTARDLPLPVLAATADGHRELWLLPDGRASWTSPEVAA